MKRAITQIFTLLLLITLAVPAFAGKVLAEIEYFYSDDGTLTGKAFNGKRVNFEYDLRGQLLAVKDAQGKDLERYTYDPAGNRLSKTINGVTTTYTYDKANQLVTSTVNGKTTHYKYDAAGRMIQAGDKKYIYNGQNKVVEVRQNGKTIAKFEYNIDGQIAKVIYGNKVEEFMWDGLALIWRSGVTYINEPYVTGGNPVMAGDNVLFNDMLGNTLAVNDKAVEMTSFGETADKNAFFTGKPMIDELGYSFLFRDYNPNQGKWTITDPLDYPDGWNNLAYCNNGVTDHIDLLGGLSLDAKITSLFILRVFNNANLVGALTNWIWTLYDFEDENKQLASVIEVAIKNHIGVLPEGETGVLKGNIAALTSTQSISFHNGLAGFLLSSCSNVFVDVKYKRINNNTVIQGSYRWQDSIDGNSFPGIAYLKGEGKNVYENEGDWIARIIQTIEGFEDLFLESGLNHVHFNVNISGTFSGVIE